MDITVEWLTEDLKRRFPWLTVDEIRILSQEVVDAIEIQNSSFGG